MEKSAVNWQNLLKNLAPYAIGGGSGYLLGKILGKFGLGDMSVPLALLGAAAPVIWKSGLLQKVFGLQENKPDMPPTLTLKGLETADDSSDDSGYFPYLSPALQPIRRV